MKLNQEVKLKTQLKDLQEKLKREKQKTIELIKSRDQHKAKRKELKSVLEKEKKNEIFFDRPPN